MCEILSMSLGRSCSYGPRIIGGNSAPWQQIFVRVGKKEHSFGTANRCRPSSNCGVNAKFFLGRCTVSASNRRIRQFLLSHPGLILIHRVQVNPRYHGAPRNYFPCLKVEVVDHSQALPPIHLLPRPQARSGGRPLVQINSGKWR